MVLLGPAAGELLTAVCTLQTAAIMHHFQKCFRLRLMRCDWWLQVKEGLQKLAEDWWIMI